MGRLRHREHRRGRRPTACCPRRRRPPTRGPRRPRRVPDPGARPVPRGHRRAGHRLVGEALAAYAAIKRLREADGLLVVSATAIVEYGRTISINLGVGGGGALLTPC